MQKVYPNRLRGGYYAPVISRAKSPMRPGKTERERAKRGTHKRS